MCDRDYPTSRVHSPVILPLLGFDNFAFPAEWSMSTSSKSREWCSIMEKGALFEINALHDVASG